MAYGRYSYSYRLLRRFAFQSYPVIQLQLEEELNLSRFLTTLTIPIFMICSALFFPSGGKLLDRHSVKRILVWGGFIYSLSLMGLYLTVNYISFIIVYALPIALGATLMGNLSTSKLVSSWFDKQAGRALGIAAMGVSFAGFIFPNLTQYFLMDILLLEWRGSLSCVWNFLTDPYYALDVSSGH